MPVGPGAVFVSPRGLATALTVLLTVCAGLSLLGSAAASRMRTTVADIRDGNLPTLREAQDVDDFYNGAITIQALGLLATSIVFIIWFHRIRVNAEVFDPAGQRMRRGWAIGSWFVPVVNLWFPKMIANDAWRASTPWGVDPARGVVNAWWVLWLLSSLVDFSAQVQDLGGEGLGHAEDLEALENQASILTLSGVLGVAAAVLAILFVRRLSQRQQTKFDQGPIPPMTPAT
ncbi:DUF4328 domain-containing protein [Streptomyces millisiae]|uniref:DUF4328 domain-containing protein n=1 Tax=Streptomyces millisiae TaxID=3075542 RepID=A0ABU2LW46_9ACTN|nr:DUF4328 domain-containing protein [Streptomyces sp. DSM 44918]MDT0321794.1 DUF4328 domain-containing protein [Streptomyces sp. DSM 44918]